MSMSTLTAENAPRDPHELEKAGRFNLRRLAEQLNLFADEDMKAKILGANNLGMAEIICAHLVEKDRGSSPRQVQAPAAAPAAAAAPTAVERTPRNNGASGPAQPAPQAAQSASAAPQVIQLLGDLISKVGKLDSKLDNVLGFQQEHSTLHASTQALLASMVHNAAGNQNVVLSALAIIASERLQCSPADFVRMALEDVKDIEKVIVEAKGK